MTIKEITLTGEIQDNEVKITVTSAGVILIQAEAGKDIEQRSDADLDYIFNVAARIQLLLDGYKQTSSCINVYFKIGRASCRERV